MKLTRQSDQVIIVESQENGFAFLFLACFVACAALDIVRYLKDPGATSSESFQGALGGAFVGLVGFLAVFESSSFIFDRSRQEVRWQRRRALSRRSGVIPFARIDAVTTQTPIGDHGIPSRRIALIMQKQEIPLTVGYAPDHDDKRMLLADEIRRFTGGSTSPTANDNLPPAVRVALQAGHTVEAIRLLRQERQMTLTEAKNLLDQIRGETGRKKEA